MSLQISGTFIHTDLVIPGDQDNLLSIGGAVRVPLTKSVSLSFQIIFIPSVRMKVLLHGRNSGVNDPLHHGTDQSPRDVFGSWGGNINCRSCISCKLYKCTEHFGKSIPGTYYRPWGNGEFRWGFTLTRNLCCSTPNKSNEGILILSIRSVQSQTALPCYVER